MKSYVQEIELLMYQNWLKILQTQIINTLEYWHHRLKGTLIASAKKTTKQYIYFFYQLYIQDADNFGDKPEIIIILHM